MGDWNSALYLRFEDERTRPAAELLGRVPLEAPATVVDLGCGPGNSTELLAARFPAARLLGLDSSPAMIEAARRRLPGVLFEQSDVAAWRPDRPADLLFANAVLQWLPDHAALLPCLMDTLAPGGVLAIQMPDNLDEPSHRLMRETAEDARWAATIGDAAAVRERLLTAQAYYDLLAPLSASVDLWRTTYYHRLADAAAIVDWLRATGLRPFLDRLDDEAQAAFLSAYRERLARAYPPRADRMVLLAFPRLFFVAQR